MDAGQLAATVSILQAAVSAHTKLQPLIHAPTVLPPDTAPSTTPPNSAADDAMPLTPLAMLRGCDGTTTAAAFGCVARLLQVHRKLQHTRTTPSARAADHGRSQQSLLAGLNQAATSNELPAAGQAHTGDSANMDPHVDMSSDDVAGSPSPGVLQDVPGQVKWLTGVLKLPWQLQSAEGETAPGR